MICWYCNEHVNRDTHYDAKGMCKKRSIQPYKNRVPVGTKLDAVREAQLGEYIIDSLGHVDRWKWNDVSAAVFPIIVPDNVYGVINLEDVKVPEGYERVDSDWFREPTNGESYINSLSHNLVVKYSGAFEINYSTADKRRIIVRPVKKKKFYLVVDEEIPYAGNCIGEVCYSVGFGNPKHPVKFRVEEREQ